MANSITSTKQGNVMVKTDRENKFKSMFNLENGFYMRSGILENGEDTGKDPFMTNFPELIDVGVMGHCIHGESGLCIKSGVECYQDGLNTHKDNMSFEDFKKIVDECKGKTFQLALGGRGDVNKHENFKRLVSYCKQNNIIPNYTTSGLDLTDREVEITKEFCGAVAVSEYNQPHTRRAIKKFVNAGVTTNIHYVLSNNSIDDAINKLKNNGFDDGINAVIFLLHKPVGLGSQDNVLDYNDPKVKEFYKTIDDLMKEKDLNFQIGFDSCNVPGIINLTNNINRASIDTCEGGRWSMYITADLIATPCSFDQKQKWGYDISNDTIENAWKSDTFDNFRNHFNTSCNECSDYNECLGGCPVVPEIVLCERDKKDII
jgi:radical SAM protein with 4Fe4S-binding SPASM domain